MKVKNNKCNKIDVKSLNRSHNLNKDQRDKKRMKNKQNNIKKQSNKLHIINCKKYPNILDFNDLIFTY